MFLIRVAGGAEGLIAQAGLVGVGVDINGVDEAGELVVDAGPAREQAGGGGDVWMVGGRVSQSCQEGRVSTWRPPTLVSACPPGGP